MKPFVKLFLWMMLTMGVLSSCTTLKPYERVYVNDSEMQMGASPSKKFQHYTHSIREGAVPAQGQKGNGGCGCN